MCYCFFPVLLLFEKDHNITSMLMMMMRILMIMMMMRRILMIMMMMRMMMVAMRMRTMMTRYESH